MLRRELMELNCPRRLDVQSRDRRKGLIAARSLALAFNVCSSQWCKVFPYRLALDSDRQACREWIRARLEELLLDLGGSGPVVGSFDLPPAVFPAEVKIPHQRPSARWKIEPSPALRLRAIWLSPLHVWIILVLRVSARSFSRKAVTKPAMNTWWSRNFRFARRDENLAALLINAALNQARLVHQPEVKDRGKH